MNFNKVKFSLITFLFLTHIKTLYAEDYFYPGALDISNSVDTTFFVKNQYIPGFYDLNVYLNGKFQQKNKIKFIDKNGELKPEISKSYLLNQGVKENKKLSLISSDDVINDLNEYYKQASFSYDINKGRFDITIPQVNLNRRLDDKRDPKSWDNGINAFRLNYTLNGSHTFTHHDNSENYFLKLEPGINYAGWRLRSNFSYAEVDESVKKNIFGTHASHEIRKYHSQFSIGEVYTKDDLFENNALLGVQLFSDEEMKPDYLRQNTPLIQGVAYSNAVVIIKQNGNIIYQMNVPPGAFEINDLIVNNQAGNLEVTVKESSGKDHQFTVPFSSTVSMQHEGQWKFSLSAGKYQSQDNYHDEPVFFQGSFAYGLSRHLTLLAGTVYADKYNALASGVNVGLNNFGAFSLGVSRSSYDSENITHNKNINNLTGYSYKVGYQKTLYEFGTTFALGQYQYNGQDYYDFEESNRNDDYTSSGFNNKKKSRYELSLNQNLGGYGSINAAIYRQDYRDNSFKDINYNINYTVNVFGANISLNYNKTESQISSNAYNIGMNVQYRLGSNDNPIYTSYNINNDNEGNTSQEVTLSGSSDDNTLNYYVTNGYRNDFSHSYHRLGANYITEHGRYALNYSHEDSSDTIGYDMNGGIIINNNQVTFSQYLAETIGIVKLDNGHGTKIKNQTGVKVDNNGYAVISNIRPYNYMNIDIDTLTLPNNLEVMENRSRVMPTRGAIVQKKFDGNWGYKAIIHITYVNQKLPFGSVVRLVNTKRNRSQGIIDEFGDVYLTGLPKKGTLKVSWGGDRKDTCYVDFNIYNDDLNVLSENCHK
ncbi:fimbria/pilus outer membrane usher protein [Vibrio algicola]|uniref:Fimbria/pilus outer membrane usher protein n=1 Tax=Vibrio algicola TaxID=2662262 RepID=A0A5Q0TL11_9VIBR|nr:fimbria/pilus outer membrane usher protein [Vibrio algicola]